jgi:putative ABC transport system ATP-binding protein
VRFSALAVAVDATRVFGSGETRLTAVHDATCIVSPGTSIAITGPSGSGKSTLLHLLAGLDRPTSGTVTWPALEGRSLRPGPVSVVFQSPSLLPALDVTENVALPLLLAGAEGDEATGRARAALEQLGLDPLGDKLPEELSGGQAQRVAVARSLAEEPRVIFADEPTGQLDRVTGAAILGALLDVVDRSGTTLVVTTHDPTVAARLAVRWRMDDGDLTTGDPTS